MAWRALGVAGIAAGLIASSLTPAPAASVRHAADVGAFQLNASLTAVPRLGSHHNAVLDVRQAAPGGHRQIGITARAGATGKEIWHRTLEEQYGETIQLYPTVIGTKSDRGLLALDFYTTPSANPGTQNLVLRMRGLSGGTGKVLWTKSLAGTLAAGGTSSNLPYFDGILANTPSGVPSFLVERRSQNGSQVRTDADLMSGTNGALTSLMTVTSPGSFEPLPDADGNGSSDVALIEAGSTGFVMAFDPWQPRNQNLIWQVDIPSESLATVQSIGTFGRTPSLLIDANQPSGPDLIDVVALKTGAVQWSRTAQGAFPIGKTGPSGVSGILLYAEDGAVTGSTWTTTLHYTAVSPANTVLYAKTLSTSVTSPAATTSTGGFPTMSLLGDVEPDGGLDFTAGITATARSATVSRQKSVEGVISGRLGRFTPVDFQEAAAGSLHRGTGLDLISAGVTHGHPQVTAIRGSTGKRLYRRTYSRMHGWQAAWVTGAKVTGHGCSAIGLESAKTNRGLVAMLDGRGDVLWTATFSPGQSVGGSLVTHPAPRRFCP